MGNANNFCFRCHKCRFCPKTSASIKKDGAHDFQGNNMIILQCNGVCSGTYQKGTGFHFESEPQGFAKLGMELRWCRKCAQKHAKESWVKKDKGLMAKLKESGLLTRRRLLARLQSSRAR